MTNLYIDGTNLFAGQVDIFGINKYLDFAKFIDQISKYHKIDKIYFYASYLAGQNKLNSGLKKLLGVEAKFYQNVKVCPRLEFYKGHRSPTSGKEKGVDVHLASDIVKGALLDEYQKLIIITGDADLIYPLEIAKRFGKNIHAVFLPNRFSLEIAFRVDSSVVFNYQGRFKIRAGKLPKTLKIVKIKAPHVNTRGR